MKLILSALLPVIICSQALAQTKVSTNGNKYVLLEYATSVGVHFSPDADYTIEQIKTAQPKAVCIALHNNFPPYTDAMMITDNAKYVAAFVTGYPAMTADRAMTTVSAVSKPEVTQRPDWATAISERMVATNTYDITMIHSYNPATKNIVVDVTGKALGNLSGDYHFNVYIVEDSVVGTGPTYDQRNIYNTQSGHPYFGMGNPIQGYNHMQVLRAMLGNFSSGNVFGTYTISNPTINSVNTQTFSYTLPAGYNPDNIRLVGFVSKYNASDIKDRVVQNCISAKLTECIEPPVVQICAASYNEDSSRNIITWEKTGIPNVLTYNIYKEGSTPGQYSLLSSQLSAIPGSYTDNITNPATESSRYKLTITDSCGREKPIDSSVGTKTMLLKSTTAGNSIKLDWTLYEGASGTNIHHIMRSIDGAPYQSIGTTNATVTTHSSALPANGLVKYKIQIINPQGFCSQDTISSNTVTEAVGIPSSLVRKGVYFQVYPNPAINSFNITALHTGDKVILHEITGRIAKEWDVTNMNQSFEISDLKNGIYFIKVYDKNWIQVANLKLHHSL